MRPSWRGARLEPITWHEVAASTGPAAWRQLRAAREWCRLNVGVERADWEYQALHRRWRFRRQEDAMLFALTWCG